MRTLQSAHSRTKIMDVPGTLPASEPIYEYSNAVRLNRPSPSLTCERGGGPGGRVVPYPAPLKEPCEAGRPRIDSKGDTLLFSQLFFKPISKLRDLPAVGLIQH